MESLTSNGTLIRYTARHSMKDFGMWRRNST